MSKNEYIGQVNEDMLKYIPFKIIPGLSTIFVILILTSQLPLADYGKYSSILVTVLLISQFTGTWIYSAVLYAYPKFYEAEGDLFKYRIIGFQILLIIPGALICLFVVYYLTGSILIALFASALLMFQVFNSLIYSFMQSLREVSLQTKSVLIQVILHLFFLSAFLLFFKKSLSFAIIAIAISYFFCFIYTLRKSHISIQSLFGAVNLNVINYSGTKAVVQYGLPLALWFFSTQLFTLGDRLILNFYNLDEGLGMYSTYRDLLTGGFSFFSMPLLLASHPIIMKMWTKNVDKNKIEQILSDNVTLIILLFLPVMMFIYEFGSVIFLKWMNYQYFNKEIVVLIMFSIMTSAIGIYSQKGLEVIGNTRLMAKIAIFVVLASIGFNFLAIGFWGVNGLAVVNLLSQILYMLIVYNFGKKYLKIKINSISIIFVFIFCVAMKILFLAISFNNPVKQMIIYLSGMLIMFFLIPETKKFLQSLSMMIKGIFLSIVSKDI